MADAELPMAGSTPSPSFHTTHWSVVLEAGHSDSLGRSAALEQLCRTYWYPLYAFVRRRGYNEEDAKDLTQEFFSRLIANNDFKRLDRQKGKFRTFLLASLSHLLSNERDRTQALKRGGGQAVLSLDELALEEVYRTEPASGLSPDRLFDLRWATTVLEQALARLREDWRSPTKSAQFVEFKKYLTEEAGPGDYAETAERLEMSTQAVAVAVHRIRQRYRELVRTEVARTVTSPLELEEEMRHLYAVLSQ